MGEFASPASDLTGLVAAVAGVAISACADDEPDLGPFGDDGRQPSVPGLGAGGVLETRGRTCYVGGRRLTFRDEGTDVLGVIDRIADGRTDLVFEHVAEGHAATSTDARGVSLLQWCAYYGDVSAMRCLLDNGASLGSLGDNLDLNGAAFHGHWQLCQFLIERGAEVSHALPDTGETPLHSALCKAGRMASGHVVRVLLAAGADPNRATVPGAESGSFMRDCRTRGETCLHRAAAFAGLEIIELLLAAGARLDARDANGDSPLTWASWHLRPAFILERLSFGGFSVHPEAVERSVSEQRSGPVDGLAAALLGTPHL